MPREIAGQRIYSLDEAARLLGVSSKTLKGYIKRKVVPDPGTTAQGLRDYYNLTDGWVEQARLSVERYRVQKRLGSPTGPEPEPA
jgi:DNA-binding transcriptional MerR regulator